MGSKGSQTVTQSGYQNQQYTPNAPIGGMVQNAGQMATTAAGAPFQQPVAPVAPFNAFQGLGFGETLGLQGMAQPYFNTAGNYLAGSAAPITGSDVANYLNPMTANVTAQLQNIFGQQNVQNTGNLVQSAGGVGADRIGVGQANMANQQTLAAGQVYSQLYQQALQAAQQNKQMQAGAGFAFGQMGPAAQAAQQNAINQLLGVGAQQQQLSQAQMNAIYQNQLAQIAYPFQTAQYLSGITAGLAPAMGGQTQGNYSGQTTYPSPSPLAQGLGIGTGLLGMFGGMGGMGALGGAIGGLSGIQSAVPGMPFMGGGFMAPGTTYIGGNPYPMYDEGGAVDDNYGKLADREKYQEYGSVIPYAAKGNPIAETFLKDVGYDDGGSIDPTLGQPAPMGLNLDPGSGLPFPGAGKVRGSPVPQMQLPTGQGGKSGPYGQTMFMHPPPSMPQGGGQQQSPMGGLGNLGGSLGKILGGLGGGSGAAADAGAGAGIDFLGGATDLGASIDSIGAMLPLALARRGGRIPRMAPGGIAPMGQPATPMPPMAGPVPPSMTSPMSAMPPPGTGPQAFPPPGAPAQPPPLSPTGVSMPPSAPPPGQMSPSTPPGGAVPPGTSPPNTLTPSLAPPGQTSPGMPPTSVAVPRQPGMPPPLSFSGTSPFSGPMPSRPPGMAGGGSLDDYPTIGPGNVPQAPPPPMPRPHPMGVYKGSPTQYWDFLGPAGHQREEANISAAGGGVDPMYAGQGFDDGGDVAPPIDPRASDEGALSQAWDLIQSGASAAGDFLRPYLAGGDRVPAMASPNDAAPKDDSRVPISQPVSPDNIAPMGGDVPMPRPNPLGGLTPEMREKFPALRSAAAERGVNFDIGEGYRPQERQNQLYAQGRGMPGPVVTDTLHSNHTTGNAVDVVPSQVGTDITTGQPFGNVASDEQIGRTVTGLTRTDPRFANMRSGATFNGLYDPRHVEILGNQEARTPGGAPIAPSPSMLAGPMGSRQVPFPNATDPNSFARRYTGSPWDAVARAGWRMAQTRGPIGSVLGAGGEEFERTLQGQRQALDTEEAINQRAEHLGLLADQHLRQWSQMTPYQQQETDIQRQRLAMLQDKMKEMTPYQHAQVEATIRRLHPEFDSLSEDQQNEIRLGIYAHPELISGGAQPEQPKVGDTKQFKQGLGRWDGKQWVPAG